MVPEPGPGTPPPAFAFEDDDFTEDTTDQKEVWMVYGEKGVGKTTFALGFPNTKVALSFDRKTRRVKARMFAGDDDIRVYDASRFYRGIPEDDLPYAGAKSIAYIKRLLTKIEPQPEWVILDGLDVMIEMAEMAMRQRHSIKTFDGVEWQFWKSRKAYLREIHGLALELAEKGIIYCANSDENKLIEEGRLVRVSKAPHWVDIIASETDNVVRMDMRRHVKKGTRFIAIMETIKVGSWESGMELDMTNASLTDAEPLGVQETKAIDNLFSGGS